MIIGRPVTFCGDGVHGTLSTLYPGTCIASPSPGCTLADIVVPTVGTLYGVQQTQVGRGYRCHSLGPGCGPGSW